MADDVFETKEWVYCGVRLDSKGKLYHQWLDHDGEVRHYQKIKGSVINATYKVETCGDRARPDARYVGPAGHESGPTWTLEARSAQAEAERSKAEARMRKQQSGGTDLGSLTLAQLKDQMNRGLYHQRAGTLAAVLQYLGC